MSLHLLALLMMQVSTAPANAGPTVTGTYDGRCAYPDTVRARGEGAMLVTCNRVTINGSAITFGERDWGARATFSGAFDGDVMTVTRITLHNGEVIAAEGTCELFYANQRLSTVACLATTRLHQTYAANIVIPHL